jgi:hypothetical protein
MPGDEVSRSRSERAGRHAGRDRARAGRGQRHCRRGQGAQGRDAEIAAIEKESKDKTGLRSDVVSLLPGRRVLALSIQGLHRCALVFAPEQQAAFFGGDPDNFTYPRYDLDMAIFRVYENGKPLHTDNFLKWSAKGAAPGELIFISGHPGSTERDDTMAQLLNERDVRGPAITEYLQRRIATAQAFAAQGPEQARLVGSTIFFMQNSLKVYQGRAQKRWPTPPSSAKKQAEEADFRAKVAANPEWKRNTATPGTIASAEEKVKPEIKGQFSSAAPIASSSASRSDRAVRGRNQEARRRAPRRSSTMPAWNRSVTRMLFAGPDLSLHGEALHDHRAQAGRQEKLGKNDAYVQAILQGGDVDTTVNALVDGTKLADPAFRKALLDGGEAAVAASTDPMIVAARRVDPIVRETNRRMQRHHRKRAHPGRRKAGQGPLPGLWQGRLSRRHLHAAPELRHGRGLSPTTAPSPRPSPPSTGSTTARPASATSRPST